MTQISKIYVALSSLTLVTLLVVATTANAQDNQALLTAHTWVIDYPTTLANLHNRGQQQYDSLNDEVKTRIDAGMDGRTIVFASDGRYQMAMANGQSIDGIWELLPNGKDLEITFTGGHKVKQRIKTLENGLLVLQLKADDDDKALFHYWYLIPSNP
ncbi:MAG: hypothetical protein AAFX87_24560 [Bacteroidota bacterium]